MNVPIVDNKGNPTPYFQRILEEISDAKISASVIDAMGGDPGGDRVVVWDDSTGDLAFMTTTEVLDFVTGASHGDILYRDSTGWETLQAGTAGQLLQTNGAGADPTWVDTPSSGVQMLHFSWFTDITVGFTLNINSSTYIPILPLFAWLDGSDFPATHYRLIARGQSNAAGQTVSFQLTRGGSAVHTGGNDLLFTSAANQTVDTGWRTVDISLSGLGQLIIQGKGSNATVDFVGPSPWDLYLKIDS
jgi:hypothetical protein